MKRSPSLCLLLCLLLSLAACAAKEGEPAAPAEGVQGPTQEETDLSAYFGGVRGCAVLYDPAADHYTVYDPDLADTPASPCSTFKIISALMGLRTGVLTGPESTMAYSGLPYPVAAWNGELDLEQAFQSSCVWYFRQVIDQVGREEVAAQLAALDYGNQDISQWEGGGQNSSAELNGFWLDSSLKISPRRQVQVLADIFEGRSLYTPQEVAILREIMLVEDTGQRQVYGKTGTGFGETAWFVGFSQKDGQPTYFAVYLADETKELAGDDAKAVALALLP